MPRGIPGSGVKSGYLVCTEGFVVGLRTGEKTVDKWFRAGQRVHESNAIFQPSDDDPEGIAAGHRKERFFLPEDMA